MLTGDLLLGVRGSGLRAALRSGRKGIAALLGRRLLRGVLRRAVAGLDGLTGLALIRGPGHARRLRMRLSGAVSRGPITGSRRLPTGDARLLPLLRDRRGSRLPRDRCTGGRCCRHPLADRLRLSWMCGASLVALRHDEPTPWCSC